MPFSQLLKKYPGVTTMNKPCYICFEGLDGSGKSTVFKKVCTALKEKGFNVCELCPTKKIDGTDFLEKLFDKYKFFNRSRFLRQFLYAHRSNFVAERIDWNADIILGDRSIITSYITRFSESPLISKFLVWKTNFLESKIPAPNFVIYLEVPPEVLQKRLKLRGNLDIDENEKRSLEMRRAYEFLMKNPKFIRRIENTKWKILNGNLSEKEVFQNAWNEIVKIINKNF